MRAFNLICNIIGGVLIEVAIIWHFGFSAGQALLLGVGVGIVAGANSKV